MTIPLLSTVFFLTLCLKDIQIDNLQERKKTLLYKGLKNRVTLIEPNSSDNLSMCDLVL